MTREPIPRWKDGLRKVAAIVALGGAAGTLVGCSPEKAPTPPAVSTSQAGESPSPSASDTVGQWLPKKGDYLALDKLAQLKSDAEITDYVEFQDGDFANAEDLARLDVYRDQAYLNAGNTDEEWEQFKDNTIIDAFADAQAKRYTAPMLRGMYAPGLTNENFKDLRFGILQRDDASRRYAQSDEGKRIGVEIYKVTRSFVEVISSEGSVKEGKMTVTYRLKQADNLDATKLTRLQHYDSLRSELVKTLTIERQHDGTWKTTAGSTKDLEETAG